MYHNPSMMSSRVTLISIWLVIQKIRHSRVAVRASRPVYHKRGFVRQGAAGTWRAFRDSYNLARLIKRHKFIAGCLPAKATSARRQDSIAFKPVSRKPKGDA